MNGYRTVRIEERNLMRKKSTTRTNAAKTTAAKTTATIKEATTKATAKEFYNRILLKNH